MSLTMRIPDQDSFTSRLRSPAVAARIGLWLGICFGIAFVTGLISHYAQASSQPVPIPTRPVWGYRLSQGLHVVAGTAAVPLLLVKMWVVYPRLFVRPPRRLAPLVLTVLERGSIATLVGAALFELSTGLANAAQWYPWSFSFRGAHHAMAWVAIGSLLVHIGVKLPVIREALAHDVDDTALDAPGATEEGPVTRRGLLRSTWLAAGVAAVAAAGGTFPVVDRIAVLAARRSGGPGGIPINRTARAAGVLTSATDPAWTCSIQFGARTLQLGYDDLRGLEQHTTELPIACVEGWSASGTWTGVRIRDLLALVEAPADAEVAVHSLQQRGGGRLSVLPAHFATDDRTLLALELNGERLSLDHGFPVRLIAPNRPGVLQTKWVARLEVLA
ncbi:MAG: molybdopterin-dependent oxidoreductase [Propionibacteriales bacterium]|nr:molybdopterin-dependent oxidoreductase [Propionibacteriales bacterium]